MGHFGLASIGLSCLCFVLPALMLNYMGQGAMVIEADMGARLGIIQDKFFLMMPDEWRIPVVLPANLATIIARQAVISGAFSLTQQAIKLSLRSGLSVDHTSASTQGQNYIPVVNRGLTMMGIM